MRHNCVERKKELECVIALRKKELGELQQRKAQLEGELSIAHDGLDADDLSATFPVLDYCGVRPRKDARLLRIEDIGSVMAQFDIASRALTQRNRELTRELNELNRHIEAEGRRYRKTKEESELLTDATGVLINRPTNSANGRNSLPWGGGENVSIQELEAEKALVAKEIRLGRMILNKKENAIMSMINGLRERADILDEIDELNNEIRVVVRDTKCAEETLRELGAECDIVDAKLNELEDINTSASRLLACSGIAEIKEELEERVNVVRRAQEKIIKAQDRRVEQLEHRLRCIEKALQNNHLACDVNAYLTTKWSTSRELIPVESSEEMYNLDAVKPADEKCHSAIYNLLELEEKRLSNRMRLLNCVKEEKERVVDVLEWKVRALSSECQEAIRELDQVHSDAAYEEERQRIEAMEYIHEQRINYSNLFLEKQRLKSKLFAAARKKSQDN